MARRIGLFMAMFLRIALLLLLSYIIGLVEPLFSVMDQAFSGRDLILLAGGLFLIWKSTAEIHQSLEGEDEDHATNIKPKVNLTATIVQIIIIDLVFSLDSIITAVGMVNKIPVMVAAVVIAMLVMLLFVNQISAFVDRHPTIKMLALSFLILIGTMLVAEGFGQHINKGYIYFAMAFSVAVEFLNIRMRKAQKVDLHQPYR
jgi:predicted tellurium resistance membrane protein TerC